MAREAKDKGQTAELVGREDTLKLIVQPEAGIVPVVQAIRRARRCIDVCIFRLNREEIEKALEAAVRRGVLVRALIAHRNSGGENRLRKLEQRLLAAGVTVTRSPDDLLRYHGKFMLVDDTLHLFGFNFTKIDMDKTRSFGIATKDVRTVQESVKLFNADVARQPYVASRSNLVVSPDTARPMLEAFLRGARKELAIYDERITDPAMVRILKERAAKGVRVRVIGDLKGPDGDVFVQPLKSMRLHVRAIVRDNSRVFVGSQSLRKDELESRREVGLLINNPTTARQLMKVFEADWEECVKSKVVEDTKEDEKKENVQLFPAGGHH